MPYRILQDSTLYTSRPEADRHAVGTILPDSEVPDFIRQKIAANDPHYRRLIEPLTEAEAFEHRARDTALEGHHEVGGRWIAPPWPDYVGLHTDEVIGRMRESDEETVAQIKLYERGGLARPEILNFELGSGKAPDPHATSAKDLRWSFANPNDAAHIVELETRVSDLENSVQRLLDALDRKLAPSWEEEQSAAADGGSRPRGGFPEGFPEGFPQESGRLRSPMTSPLGDHSDDGPPTGDTGRAA
jgi:hypothetical protein